MKIINNLIVIKDDVKKALKDLKPVGGEMTECKNCDVNKYGMAYCGRCKKEVPENDPNYSGQSEKKLDFEKSWKSRVIFYDLIHDKDIHRLPVTYGNLKDILSEMFEYIEQNLQARKCLLKLVMKFLITL